MTTVGLQPVPIEQDESRLIAERGEKLKALRATQAVGGAAAFPNDFTRRRRRAAQLHAAYS